MSARRMAGVTLVELVIAIVILSVALAGLVAAFARATRASTDPVVTRQMVAIAESMMEEVLLKPYAPAAGGSTRTDYNDIWDFNAYPADSPVTDIGGGGFNGLERYTVTVTVEALAAGGVTGIAAAGDAARIRVTVRHGAGSFTLTGWRTRP
ncbi:type IV pilus modification PilV family protein [Massilia consociata]|uniref:Prepilin-type N-terminal cleavage/methylation domain-containing protein n=1 Tax=Massilia consociata TaxID=760117 RepID=A0ABV6FJE4_9BURK